MKISRYARKLAKFEKSTGYKSVFGKSWLNWTMLLMRYRNMTKRGQFSREFKVYYTNNKFEE